MGLASSADNIRFNGTGRFYMGAVGASAYDDIGELETLTFEQTVSEEKLKSTRNAARGTILTAAGDTEAKITFGAREWTKENLQAALMGSTPASDNQAASYLNQVVPSWASDKYVDLGKQDVNSTKLTGTITGTMTVGSTVTGATSTATAKIAYIGSSYIEVVNVSGTFQTGEQVYQTSGSIYITTTGVAKNEDVVVTDSTGATRRVQGTDYSLDPDAGMIRKLSTGSIVATDVVSADYPALTRNVVYGQSSSTFQKKLFFISDKDDNGVRTMWTFWKVNLTLNGSFPLIGDGVAALGITATVLKDTTQASGQEYYKVVTIED